MRIQIFGETPQAALKREYMEETNVEVEPKDIIGIRFNMHDWYVVFRAEYVSGEAMSDHDENSEVLCIQCAIFPIYGLKPHDIQVQIKAERIANMSITVNLYYTGKNGSARYPSQV